MCFSIKIGHGNFTGTCLTVYQLTSSSAPNVSVQNTVYDTVIDIIDSLAKRPVFKAGVWPHSQLAVLAITLNVHG